MTRACVCYACKQVFLNHSRLSVARQCVWRAHSTSANHLQIPPFSNGGKEKEKIDKIDPQGAAWRRYNVTKRAPSRSAENDFLHSIFQGRSGDDRLYASHKEASEEQPSLSSVPGSRSEPDLKALRPALGDRTVTKNQTVRSSRTRTEETARLVGADKFQDGSPVNKSRPSSAVNSIPLLDKSRYESVAPTQAEPTFRNLREDVDNECHSSDQVVDYGSEFTPQQKSRRTRILSNEVVLQYQSRIGKAIERQDVSGMETLWMEAQRLISDIKRTSDQAGPLSQLYAHFLRGFTSVHRPNLAIQIWNAMVTAQIRPTVKMWDTMLNGFGIVRNSAGVQDIWIMMIHSGFKPDKRLWVTRIRALSASGSWSLSLQAFEEMMNLWMRAVKDVDRKGVQFDLKNIGDAKEAPKPSNEALNAVVSGLVRFQRQEELMRVLFWAQALGIRMDSYTFNPIIRMALKQGNGLLVNKIVGKMQDLGIKQDIATYTMILQALFQQDRAAAERADVSKDPVNEKLDAAASVLEEIELFGLEANAYTFSTLISGLLNDDINIEAANAVRMYMAKKNIALSSQIYTSFVTAHFARKDGPDVAGVVAEWEQARGDRNIILDGIFYDRLIEGFARYGDTRKMKTALAQAGESGNVPGWIALTEAVSALAKADDWDGVEEILRDVRDEELALDRVRKGKGKKWFWDAVRAMGLGDEMTSRVAEDVATGGVVEQERMERR